MTSHQLCHGKTTLPIDKMLNFDINTTDTQKQQLYHGDIILAHNKLIICITLHLTFAISTKSQPMPILFSSSLAGRVFNP